jgi:hypothetical protein
MNIGELFRLLNTPYCEETFYINLTNDNKNEIITKMMDDEEFMGITNEFEIPINVIRSKIETKLEQILKKKGTRLVTPHEIFLANLDGISEQLDKCNKPEINKNLHHETSQVSLLSIPIVQVIQEIEENDEDNGKHIGSGIYLKREDHLIKMTTPNFVVYY